MRKNVKGFTLIEMIVVVTILGILLGIMVPGVLHYISNAKEKECATNRKTLLLELDARRVLNPEKDMGDIIGEHGEIQCPEGGEYRAVGKNAVECTIHGSDSLFSGDSKESFEDIAGLETNVVKEEADGTVTTPPTAPSEPDDRPNPDNVVADGDLLLRSLHDNQDTSKSTQKGVVYKIEQLDGSFIYGVGVKPGYWDGYDSDENITRKEIYRIDFSNIYKLEDFGPVDEAGNCDLRNSSQQIQPGKIFYDAKNEKYYVCNKEEMPRGWGSTNFSNPDHWTELELD